MKTAACATLGIDIPIIQAPMQGAVGPRLAAAVSNAGALGMLAPWADEIDKLRQQIRETQTLTSRPFGVNLNTVFTQEEHLDACLQEGVSIISFFWQDPGALVMRAKAKDATVLYTVASSQAARTAVREGVDIIVAQGWEAGGHVRGTVATMPLVPAIVDAVSPVPVIAAGGIADGRGLAAALSLGASAAWIGTRFLASEEAGAHPDYVDLLLEATEESTLYAKDLFTIGWSDAPHRVLHNTTAANWQAAGRPPMGKRPSEGEVIASSKSLGTILRYQSDTPAWDMEGNIEAMALYAGQSVGLVKKRQSAGDIVREISEEAKQILQNLAR